MKEDKHLEFKQAVSNTFLKTVSAFANYGGGTILFGVDDKGKAAGFDDPEQQCLNVENRINDSIRPQPAYSISVNRADRTISLRVEEGTQKPYFYKAKAYKRNDTATISVDDLELKRLVLEGEHVNYEALPAKEQELSFDVLARALREQRGISRFDRDTLKTLDLYADQTGYNKAAEILADENGLPGVDMAKFGETINIIQKRATFDHRSVISAYDEAVALFRDYYTYEVVDSARRRRLETIPEAAFREALANALIHRQWDVASHVRVFMFDDRVEIISPGGLPNGISADQYRQGRVSILRNPVLANVFNRLDMAETFGTGVVRIKEAYAKSVSKPEFEESDCAVRVTLPVIKADLGITDDERVVYDKLSRSIAKPMSSILASPQMEYGKSKVTGILKSLNEKGIVKIEGNGRGTKYRLE